MVDIPIQENDRRIQIIASAAQIAFVADFLIFFETDFTVLHTDNSVTPAVTSTLVLNVDYTVTGTEVLAGFSIFLDSVAFPGGAVSGDVFTIFGDLVLDRPDDFQTAGDFNAAVVNAELDKVWQAFNEINTKLVRSLSLLEEDDADETLNVLPLDRALKFLGFDAAKNPVSLDGVAVGTVPISSFWAPILALTSFPTSGIAALALVNAFTRAQGFTPATLTGGVATITWDGDTEQNAQVTHSVTNFTLANIAGARAGFTYTLISIQDPVTPRVITFDTQYEGEGGVLPVLTPAINAVDLLTVYARTSTNLVVSAILNIS